MLKHVADRRKFIKEQREKYNYITVADLITALKKYPPSAFIGKCGHFGEAVLAKKPNTCLETATLKGKKINIIDITMPNIGIEPY